MGKLAQMQTGLSEEQLRQHLLPWIEIYGRIVDAYIDNQKSADIQFVDPKDEGIWVGRSIAESPENWEAHESFPLEVASYQNATYMAWLIGRGATRVQAEGRMMTINSRLVAREPILKTKQNPDGILHQYEYNVLCEINKGAKEMILKCADTADKLWFFRNVLCPKYEIKKPDNGLMLWLDNCGLHKFVPHPAIGKKIGKVWDVNGYTLIDHTHTVTGHAKNVIHRVIMHAMVHDLIEFE